MIKASDVAFHIPENVPYDWAETNYFSFYIPEANITAWIYTIARPGVGAWVADIQAINRIGRLGLEALYVDFQQHLPMPERLEEYSLPNGLSMRTANPPRDYHIDYVGLNDTAFHLDVKGLMEPYDIHDPDMDPLAPRNRNDSGFGSAYSNHFDMTAHFTGTARFHGTTYDVDCVATMDHSWGPRNERGLKPIGWINGNFGTDLAFMTIWTLDHGKQGWDQFGLAHGYVMRDGEARGLVSGRLRAMRGGKIFPTGYEMVVTDRFGEEYHFIGINTTQSPWSCYSNVTSIVSGTIWYYQGREGSGMSQENWPYDLLAGRLPAEQTYFL